MDFVIPLFPVVSVTPLRLEFSCATTAARCQNDDVMARRFDVECVVFSLCRLVVVRSRLECAAYRLDVIEVDEDLILVFGMPLTNSPYLSYIDDFILY